MMLLSGLISRVFFPYITLDILSSLNAWCFMIFYMLADQPHSDVTKMHGEATKRSLETRTFSTFSPSVSFMNLANFSKDAFFSSWDFFSSSVYSNSILSFVMHFIFFPSTSYRLETIYSSMASSKRITSTFFFTNLSKNGDSFMAVILSPVM